MNRQRGRSQRSGQARTAPERPSSWFRNAPTTITYDDLEIKIAARDAENRTGTEKFDYELDEDEQQIQVTTDRSIYRKGQSLKIELLSSEASESIIVDILKESSTLVSYRVKTKNGRASLRCPFVRNSRGS
ncbi:MAG: hypothetical protein IPN69_24090 [Acidobacteria bacterium]|nr:hypothetical protein [Acidobacteriota bacterium]